MSDREANTLRIAERLTRYDHALLLAFAFHMVLFVFFFIALPFDSARKTVMTHAKEHVIMDAYAVISPSQQQQKSLIETAPISVESYAKNNIDLSENTKANVADEASMRASLVSTQPQQKNSDEKSAARKAEREKLAELRAEKKKQEEERPHTITTSLI